VQVKVKENPPVTHVYLTKKAFLTFVCPCSTSIIINDDQPEATVLDLFIYVPSWSCSQAVWKPVRHIQLLCVQWKTPDDGQRNCLKHVEFRSKNKFERWVQLVGFIIGIPVGVFPATGRVDLLYYKSHSELWVLRGIEESFTCVMCSIGQSTQPVYIFLCSKYQSVFPDLLVYCR
jgi:hypothetical protein